MERFIREFKVSADTRVLDVGGTPFNWTLVSIYPALTISNLAAGDGPAVVCDGRHLPFKSGSFDIRKMRISSAVGRWAPGASRTIAAIWLAPLLVWDTDHGGLRYGGVRVQELLDLARVDVHPAADDHVLEVACDFEEAPVVHGADVTHVKPAVSIDRLARSLRHLVVGEHVLVAAQQISPCSPTGAISPVVTSAIFTSSWGSGLATVSA